MQRAGQLSHCGVTFGLCNGRMGAPYLLHEYVNMLKMCLKYSGIYG